MTTSQMHQFARMGADARLKPIREEQQAILSVFPELQDGVTPGRLTSPARRPGPRRMSAAERKAVGTRMRACWAKRRTEKASVGQAAAKRKPKGGMSAEARERQGERMRAYWAAKRAAKVNGAGQGTQSETASQNSAASRKPTRKTARRQRRKP